MTTTDHSATPFTTSAPRERPPEVVLFELVEGYRASQVTSVIARLDVAGHLAAGPRSTAELVAATGADADGLSRLLRAAVTVGLLVEKPGDRFTLTPVGACLSAERGGSLRDLATAVPGPGQWLPFGCLYEAVMTGRPATGEALGSDIWTYYRDHPVEGAAFAGAMGGLSASVSAQVPACFDASGFARIVDVGGSQGVLLTALLQAAPQTYGVLFDRPEVIAGARERVAADPAGERIECVGGDFFTDVPAGGDLYVLKSVLHDWDDEHALQILANCRRAARPDHTLLLVEGVVPTEPGPSPLHMLNLLMLVELGGRERTREQHAALLADAGYHLERVIPPPAAYLPWSLLEARPATAAFGSRPTQRPPIR